MSASGGWGRGGIRRREESSDWASARFPQNPNPPVHGLVASCPRFCEAKGLLIGRKTWRVCVHYPARFWLPSPFAYVTRPVFDHLARLCMWPGPFLITRPVCVCDPARLAWPGTSLCYRPARRLSFIQQQHDVRRGAIETLWQSLPQASLEEHIARRKYSKNLFRLGITTASDDLGNAWWMCSSHPPAALGRPKPPQIPRSGDHPFLDGHTPIRLCIVLSIGNASKNQVRGPHALLFYEWRPL